jgi:hypothetical protein
VDPNAAVSARARLAWTAPAATENRAEMSAIRTAERFIPPNI